jgi:hypothetical protein
MGPTEAVYSPLAHTTDLASTRTAVNSDEESKYLRNLIIF